MTTTRRMERSGVRRIASRSALVFAPVATVLFVAVSGRAMQARIGRVGAAIAADDSIHAVAVLAAVRGESPLACALTAHALENRWGGPSHLGGPDAAVLSDAQAAALDWAMSSAVGTDVLPVVRAAMRDPDACVRRTGAELAGRIRDGDITGALRGELGAADPVTRETAVLALGYAGRAAAEPALATAARDASVAVRRTAAWALGRADSPAGAAPLMTLLHDADAMVRVNAALSLGTLSAAAAVPALATTLAGDRDARVRRAAAAALGQMDAGR